MIDISRQCDQIKPPVHSSQDDPYRLTAQNDTLPNMATLQSGPANIDNTMTLWMSPRDNLMCFLSNL